MTNTLANIVVVGQGAMGLLWYHHLAHTNTNVTLLASNQEQLSASELKSAKYQFTPYQQLHAEIHPLTYSQSADINSADIIILCLKSFHIADAIQQMAQDINPHCLVILAHNGMGPFAEVVNLLPSQQVILTMLTTHGCLRSMPLAITHTGLGQSDIGLLAGELSSNQQTQLTNQLNNALAQVNFHQDIVKKQWLKLAINCVINPITAINNIDNGEINNQKFTRQINLILTEITAVSHTEGIELAFTDLQKMVAKVAQATARNCSSMRSDVLGGRATEIDFINGYIHRIGKKNNVATPENTRLWQQVLDLKPVH
ncbi:MULTISPECIES: ketopantoate reductase family protein [Colwellia]|uniref:2-dehydropantoate 2-reductase n=1 Tax=Colwellia marinimaniae TaxID=1513592 RepID=A0ABQ0MTC9_9GAMM|nr:MULTISPECIES: 2-dehydropantoate 2-reductase [Colwellia]GAW94886.1 2-dehydropantoate 2-reductase [Colwellia marinimaniae]